MPGIYSLKGTVKHYDWGGVSFIPSLLKLITEKRNLLLNTGWVHILLEIHWLIQVVMN